MPKRSKRSSARHIQGARRRNRAATCGSPGTRIIPSLALLCTVAALVYAHSYRDFFSSATVMPHPQRRVEQKQSTELSAHSAEKQVERNPEQVPLDTNKQAAVLEECKAWLSSSKYFREFTAQYSQDAFLFYNYYIFPQNRPSPHGFYVDLAAAEPKFLSNTYFFDKCLGWKGLCIEAHPDRARVLRQERSCTVVETCVTEQDGVEVEFAVPTYQNGTATLSNGIVSNRPGQHIFGAQERKKMKCQSLQRILQDRKVKHIDFFSLDVEGEELPAIKSVDWTSVTLDFLIAEINNVTLYHWLVENGFSYVGWTRGHWGDAIFIKNLETYKKLNQTTAEEARGIFRGQVEIDQDKRKVIADFLPLLSTLPRETS